MNLKIKYNAPVTLSYSLACFAVFVIGAYLIPVTGSTFSLTDALFTVPSSVSFEATNPLDYIRLFTHILGHANWSHLIANLSYILILGPMLETSYGSLNMTLMILVTGFATGVMNVCFFPSPLLGASGVVFMMVLLSSFTNHKKNEIPLTFILVVILFLGREIVNAFGNDDISQFAHLAGGLCGSLFGFFAQAGQTTKGKRTATRRTTAGAGNAGTKRAAAKDAEDADNAVGRGPARTKGAAYNPSDYAYQPVQDWRENAAARFYDNESESPRFANAKSKSAGAAGNAHTGNARTGNAYAENARTGNAPLRSDEAQEEPAELEPAEADGGGFGFANLLRKQSGGSSGRQTAQSKPADKPKKAGTSGILKAFKKKTGISEVDQALSDFEESDSFKR